MKKSGVYQPSALNCAKIALECMYFALFPRDFAVCTVFKHQLKFFEKALRADSSLNMPIGG
jgi:hypothetical protein